MLGVVALHLSLLLTIRISLLFHAIMLLHLALFIRAPSPSRPGDERRAMR